MTTMILLVGEQPAPNLLPLRHFAPDHVALVHTDRTEPIAKRLAKVIGAKVEKPFCWTEAYRIDLIRPALESYILKRGWDGSQLIFNVTGGTKPMATAAYEIARQLGSCAFYYQTEDNQSLIHPYRFMQGQLILSEPVPIAETLTLDDYLRLYIGDYRPNDLPKPDPFEPMVYQSLKNNAWPGLEVMPSVHFVDLAGNVEVDMLARYGNQVAAFEVKRTANKKGIDQLNGIAEQRVLGTYTKKVLIAANKISDPNLLELAKAYRITVIALESGASGQLSSADQQILIDTVLKLLMPMPQPPITKN